MEQQKSAVDSYFEQAMRDPLGPVHVGSIILGAVYEVNGEGAQELQAQVTRFELELLCEHWARQIREVRRSYLVFGQSGSREIRVLPYAHNRLDYLAEFLGDDRVESIFDRVFEGFDAAVEGERAAFEADMKARGLMEPEETVAPNLERISGADGQDRPGQGNGTDGVSQGSV